MEGDGTILTTAHFHKRIASTLALFTLPLEQEHVGVYAPLFHVLLDSLH